ncbi:MAG: hypothetical protein Q7R95_10870 [bacterium]|nr:hypothetical protein [bacterium]
MKNQKPTYFGIGIIIILGLIVYSLGNNYFKKQNKPPLSPIATTAATNITDDWKIYTNTKYGYSIKYPSTLTPIETADDVIFLHHVEFKVLKVTSISGITVEVRNFTTLEDEITYRKWQVEGHLIPGKIDSEKPVTISSLPGTMLNYTSGEERFSIAIVPYQKLVYTIVAASNQLELYNQLISTFKIVTPITSIDTTNWTLYTNKTYGYSLKFPTTYEVPPQTEKEISQKGVDSNICIKRKSNNTCSVLIEFWENIGNLSLKDYVNKNLNLFGITGPLVSYNFNGYDSLLNKNQSGTDVFVKQGQYIYHINAPTASSDKEVEDIIATFKFTE